MEASTWPGAAAPEPLEVMAAVAMGAMGAMGKSPLRGRSGGMPPRSGEGRPGRPAKAAAAYETPPNRFPDPGDARVREDQGSIQWHITDTMPTRLLGLQAHSHVVATVTAHAAWPSQLQ